MALNGSPNGPSSTSEAGEGVVAVGGDLSFCFAFSLLAFLVLVFFAVGVDDVFFRGVTGGVAVWDSPLGPAAASG